ncbi:MAG TPA: 3D domain-containing protein [Candidatus Fimivivens sp.]|nr:3D domain-containing protein [Candidatus Fimivivens sp.]
MSGKRLAFVLPVILFWTSAAHAESIETGRTDGENEILRSVAPTRPVLLKGMFSLDRVLASQSEREVEKSPEDIILERWKEKQMDRWSGLPQGKFEINASAYTASADECGKSNGVTASGIKVAANRTLACPPNYPFGAKVAIEGFGTFRCEDRGGAIKGNHFDIFMETKKEAFAFGRRHLIAEVVVD